MSYLSVENVCKTYGQCQVLKNTSLFIEQGEQCVIMGASGSGKSTLLYLIGGLDRPDSGIIKIEGQDLNELGDEALASYRNEFVGFVFQFHYLLPSMDALSNVLLPARIGGHSLPEVRKRIKNLAERLDVSSCLNKYPYQLSGGEQQRINVIRALSLQPRLLLCDEPTGNLDGPNSTKVANLLKELSLELSVTCILVTHDQQVASKFEKQLSLVDGHL